MHVAILGAGAMGSWFGGQLAVQGHQVQLLTTNTAHIDAVSQRGLVMQFPESGDNDVTVRIDAALPDEYDSNAELVIVLTKTYQTHDAIERIASKLKPHTALLSLQNGVGNADTIAAFVPQEKIWVGMTKIPVDRIAPGVVALRGEGQTYFGHSSAELHPFADHIVQAFDGTRINLVHDRDVQTRIWEKVAFNAGINPLCALTHGTPGTIGQLADSWSLLRAVATEVSLVAKAEGITIDLDDVFDAIVYACEHHGNHKTSMLQDLLAGNMTEVGALNGAIVRLGGMHGIETPLNATLTTLIYLAELGEHSIPEM